MSEMIKGNGNNVSSNKKNLETAFVYAVIWTVKVTI